ncbi:MAG: peptidase M26 [Bacteroides stercoris]|nr:peptidase M26 [Bacteroides stercoris]
MKKCFLLMAGIILLTFTACQSDELANGGRNGEVAASFSVQLPGNGNNAVTRAATAGDGTSVNRCIMEIYLNDELYSRQIGAIQPDGLTAGFDVRLVTSQTYKFVFWADHVESVEGEAIKTDLHYNTADLRNISMKGDYNGSSKDDTRDAFFASLEKLVTNAFSESVELTRPFGQLNIKTEDLASIPNNQKDAFVPVTAGLSFKNLYTGFNAATGNLLGESTAVAYKAASDVVDANGNLTVDYLFAPNTAGGQHLVNMTLAVYNAAGGQITTKDLNNIPVQRNYKTNVTGNLLTVDGKVNVTVTPAFSSPALSEKVIEVASVSEVAEALKTNTNVVVTEAPKEAATISLPKYESGDVAVSITLPETSNDITINYTTETGEESKNAPKELNITAPSASKINIEASESTVTLNGQSYTTVEATTADNTLIVESSVTIGTLTLKKGNVKLYGKITTSVSKGTGWSGTIIRCLDNQQSYDNLIADNVSGYTSILIEREASFDASKVSANASATVGKPMKIAANATIAHLKMHVDQAAVSPIEIIDGAANVVFDDLTVSSTNEQSLVKVVGTGQKVTIRNGSLLLTSGKSDQSGFNIQNGGHENTITALLEDTYIGFGATKVNVDKSQDYTYTDEKKNDFTKSAWSRAITVGYNSAKAYDGTAVTNLTVNRCVFEGVYYVINTLHNVSLNVDVDDSVLDGRAAFNIWSTAKAGSTFNVKNSKLIGRNCFSGPTEVFATVVLNGYNSNDGASVKYVRNNTITLDNCDVVSDNAPQTETNYQYGVSMRSPYYNKLILKNHTKFRETQTPRLPHVVDFNTNAWRNEVLADGSVNLDGCAAGATVLPSNKWSGHSYASVGTVADDGKIYIGDPDVLAGFIQDGANGKGVEVVLVRDLDMGSHNITLNTSFKSISNCTFNGNNHTIANYTLSNKLYAGLLPNAISVTVRNLTLKNANITAVDDGKSNAYAGGFIGCAYGTNVIENCTLENSTVQGINKVGGIAGFQAENGISIRNCTVKGSVVKVDTENQEYGQCGGILGYIGSVAAANEVSGNFIIDTKVEAPANTNAGEEHRKSSICVGTLHGVAGQSLVIDMPFGYIQGSTFNGKPLDKTEYMGLLGGVRFTDAHPSLTINGTRY